MERWGGKVAVVTGASAGIGASIVEKLVKHGMIVVGLARRVENIKELTKSLANTPGKLHAMECDVTNEENVITAFAWIENNVGSVDVLINNAGISKESSLSDGSLEDWRSILDVNILGLCVCTREAVRTMRKTGEEGAIIHVNSYAGERIPAIPGFSIYPASKRAVTGLAQSLRHELSGTPIRIMCVSPGLVATGLLASYSTFSDEAMAATPALQPEDIAAAIIYLLSAPPRVLVQDIVVRPLGEAW